MFYQYMMKFHLRIHLRSEISTAWCSYQTEKLFETTPNESTDKRKDREPCDNLALKRNYHMVLSRGRIRSETPSLSI